jgi:hypothetical protein
VATAAVGFQPLELSRFAETVTGRDASSAELSRFAAVLSIEPEFWRTWLFSKATELLGEGEGSGSEITVSGVASSEAVATGDAEEVAVGVGGATREFVS